MAPSQESAQSTQNAETSTAERLTQAVAEKPASQLDEVESQKQSHEALDQTVLSQGSEKSSQGEPSPNALVQAGLYDNESQECATQKLAEASQKMTTASQPTEASQVASQPTTQPAEPVGSQAESQHVASQA